MRNLFGFSFVTATVCVFAFAFTACESATNLDVKYGDASAALEGSTADDAEGGAVPAPLPPNTFPGCPCDEMAGVGCCIPKVGLPFCTSDTDFCRMKQGEHLRCAHSDSTTESTCCWHYGSPDPAIGAVTAFASGCDGGLPACTDAKECGGGAKCSTVICAGITIGQCGDTPPPCTK